MNPHKAPLSSPWLETKKKSLDCGKPTYSLVTKWHMNLWVNESDNLTRMWCGLSRPSGAADPGSQGVWFTWNPVGSDTCCAVLENVKKWGSNKVSTLPPTCVWTGSRGCVEVKLLKAKKNMKEHLKAKINLTQSAKCKIQWSLLWPLVPLGLNLVS